MTSAKAVYSLENAREFQRRIPFIVQLGIVTERLSEGEARLVLPIARGLTNSFGNLRHQTLLNWQIFDDNFNHPISIC